MQWVSWYRISPVRQSKGFVGWLTQLERMIVVAEEQSIEAQMGVILVLSTSARSAKLTTVNDNLPSSQSAYTYRMALPLVILRRMLCVFLQLPTKIRLLFPCQAAESRSNRLHFQTAISGPPRSVDPGSSGAVMAV